MAQKINKTISAAVKRLPNDQNSSQVEARDGKAKVFTASSYQSPDDSLLFSNKGRLDTFMTTDCTCADDALRAPDVLEVRYTFEFPKACADFRELLSTDWYIFNTDQWTQASGRVSVNTTGFGRYVLRCPFIPCALCIQVDADTYSYSVPGVKIPKDGATTPFVTGASSDIDPNTRLGFVTGNAIFVHGVYSNLMKTLLAQAYGVRVELGCDNVVREQSLRYVGMMSSQYACDGTQTLVSPLADIENLNKTQLGVDGGLNVDYNFQAINGEPSCGAAAPQMALAPQVAASPNNCDGANFGDGCLPLPKVALMPGMGLDVIIYTLPGLQDLRDQLLNTGCVRDINPSSSGDTVQVHSLIATWINATGVIFQGPQGENVLVEAGQQIPPGLVDFINTAGVYTIAPKFAPAFLTTTTAATPTYPTGAQISAAGNYAVTVVDESIGSAVTTVINHGTLVISFALRGCYIRRSEVTAYFRKYAVKNGRLRELLLDTPAAMAYMQQAMGDSAGVMGLPEVTDLKAGVLGLPEVSEYRNRDQIKNSKDFDG